MKKIKLLLLLLVFGLSSFAQYVSNKTNEKVDTYLRPNNTRFLGDTLAFFSAIGINGKQYNSNSLKGKITFINFWFSACIPCINELDDLEAMYEKYHAELDFQFLSFTFDPALVTKKAIEKYKLPYNIITLTDEKCTELNLGKGYPTNFITDKSGTIVNISTGREIFSEENYFKNKIYPILDNLLKPAK